MLVRRRLLFLFAALLFAIALPSPADAQWYVAAYVGNNHTPRADVSIDAPASDIVVTYRDVRFSAKAFTSPQYYGYRVGRMIGERRRIGFEIEFIHLKVIGETSRDYAATGRAGDVAFTGAPVRMSDVVEQYQMTHGLNFVLINLVTRTPIGGAASPRFAIIARAGAGPTIPHAETRVAGRSKEQYEYAGVGGHLAAGLDIRLRNRLSAVVEYKATLAKPEITLASGTGRMTALTHQVAVGVAFGLAR